MPPLMFHGRPLNQTIAQGSHVNPHALYERGLAAYSHGYYQEAIANLTALIELHPWYAGRDRLEKIARYYLGLAYHASGQYDLAATQFGLVIQLNRQGVPIYFHRDLAAETLQAYIAADPIPALKNEKLERLQHFLQPL